MKTNLTQLITIIKLFCFGLLLVNCTGRQISSSGKTNNPEAKEAQNAVVQQNNTSNTTKSAKENSLPVATYDHNANNMISKIYFKKSGVVFDVYENNPYNNLNCGKVYNKTENVGNSYGSIKGKQIKNFVENLSALPYNPKITKNDIVDSTASYGYVGYSENKKWHYVLYTVQIYANSNEIYANGQWSASNSTVIILDSLGNRINTISEIGTNTNYSGLSDNGQYLLISYGFDSENDFVLKMGYKVYDLQSNKLIIDKITPESTGYMYKNLIIERKEYFSDNIGFTDLFIYDLYKGYTYSGTFKTDELDIIDIDKDGYIVGRNTGNKRKLMFNKDFKVEKLNLK